MDFYNFIVNQLESQRGIKEKILIDEINSCVLVKVDDIILTFSYDEWLENKYNFKTEFRRI